MSALVSVDGADLARASSAAEQLLVAKVDPERCESDVAQCSAEAMAEYNKVSDAASGTTKLGALLREQLNNKSE